jgi:Outer membrane protein beta-barrel domain
MSPRTIVSCSIPAVLLACPLPAAAQDAAYFGVSPLLAKYQSQDVSPNSGLLYQFDEKQDGFKVFGGLRAGKYFGMELAYDNFGEYRSARSTPVPSSAKSTVTGGSLFAMGILPVGSVDLFAKAGMVYRKRRTLIDEPAQCTEVCTLDSVLSRLSDHTSELAYGGGAALVVYGGLSLRFEYERFNFDGETDVMSLGLTWQFE